MWDWNPALEVGPWIEVSFPEGGGRVSFIASPIPRTYVVKTWIVGRVIVREIVAAPCHPQVTLEEFPPRAVTGPQPFDRIATRRAGRDVG